MEFFGLEKAENKVFEVIFISCRVGVNGKYLSLFARYVKVKGKLPIYQGQCLQKIKYFPIKISPADMDNVFY